MHLISQDKGALDVALLVSKHQSVRLGGLGR